VHEFPSCLKVLTMQYDPQAAPVDPYSDAYAMPQPSSQDGAPTATTEQPAPQQPARDRSRSQSPGGNTNNRHRSPERDRSNRRRSPPPRRPSHAPIAPNPSNVLGVFGLSIRTTERDLEDEFNRFGRVDRVTIVYDQRSDRSRGFGFIKMVTVEDATRCIQELNGVDLNGRRIRVDYSVTDRPHAPTPGEYMGHRRPVREERDRRDRTDRYDRGDRDYRRDRGDRRDDYGRDRDWRDRRSPRRNSRSPPPARKRRSYSRSPPRGGSPRASTSNTNGRSHDTN